jgi:hypothetical protein
LLQREWNSYCLSDIINDEDCIMKKVEEGLNLNLDMEILLNIAKKVNVIESS